VEVVDVCDIRLERGGYRFSLAADTKLPFEDASFDVVLSNHVIEHVRDDAAHISEIRRVLRDGGVGYLAVPIAGG
jgi:ubiquinone/menaquinone biosynthesis C-methylase UbiE